MNEKTTITLNDTDAALVLKEKGVGLYLPDIDNEDTEVLRNTMMVTILSILLENQDEELDNLLHRKIDEFLGKEKKNEKD